MAGACVAYRSKTQPIAAQSATEAELIACNAGAKVAKYVRFVLNDLGFPQATTVIYEDNEPTENIVNHNRPTERSCHIKIRYFGLQHWRALGDITLLHVPGIVNPADALTKALARVAQHRLSRFLMGHYRPPP
jgi:hypothetical protein